MRGLPRISVIINEGITLNCSNNKWGDCLENWLLIVNFMIKSLLYTFSKYSLNGKIFSTSAQCTPYYKYAADNGPVFLIHHSPLSKCFSLSQTHLGISWVLQLSLDSPCICIYCSVLYTVLPQGARPLRSVLPLAPPRRHHRDHAYSTRPSPQTNSS